MNNLHEEPESGWISAIVECDICTYTWNAVYYSECNKLQCPHCMELVNYTIIEEVK